MPKTQPAGLCPRKCYHLRIRERVLELGPKTLVMGILNVTPDSFSDGCRYLAPEAAIKRAHQMVAEGADILDLGGESTRPGAADISAEEELSRVLPVLEALAGSFPIPISIDTSKSIVAEAALERGAAFINDVTALQDDPGMGALAARYRAGLILMHMRGNPRNMQQLDPSPDIMAEMEMWCGAAAQRARNCGVSPDQIILDPGIGFGKTVEQNLELIRNLDRVAAQGYPILIGTSRKSFIGKILGRTPDGRAWGTAASVAVAAVFGAHMVRVHDVAEMRDVVDVVDAILGRTEAIHN